MANSALRQRHAHIGGMRRIPGLSEATEAGASTSEICEAILHDIDLPTYAAARIAGATHYEITDAARVGIHMPAYANARRSFGHSEVLEMVRCP